MPIAAAIISKKRDVVSIATNHCSRATAICSSNCYTTSHNSTYVEERETGRFVVALVMSLQVAIVLTALILLVLLAVAVVIIIALAMLLLVNLVTSMALVSLLAPIIVLL